MAIPGTVAGYGAIDVLGGYLPCPMLYKCVVEALNLFCGVDVPIE
jgi:sulfite exporter TauE/SafE